MEKRFFQSTRFTSAATLQWVLTKKKLGLGECCVFLEDGKCTIDYAKPISCRTFPYWPELVTRKAWRALKSICPGIDKGEVEHNNLTGIQMMADNELRRGV